MAVTHCHSFIQQKLAGNGNRMLTAILATLVPMPNLTKKQNKLFSVNVVHSLTFTENKNPGCKIASVFEALTWPLPI